MVKWLNWQLKLITFPHVGYSDHAPLPFLIIFCPYITFEQLMQPSVPQLLTKVYGIHIFIIRNYVGHIIVLSIVFIGYDFAK